ncbi:PfaD family protein [Chitinophaga sp. CF118]|uniref:PfaD family polyunsaturated fatty acid/polyketide biosynthesis protein n=1 Tax=Chitinophaga sp. CF118 TaxID=1884367 RepID=UPI0008EDCF31|nr:PfaD family polyunsaturated fatty acid/polyketide biosynthesis protein [Chitinophaga sp. CF118]SFD49936.1 PfaD family protein [Chitinophaga sp. CF118]
MKELVSTYNAALFNIKQAYHVYSDNNEQIHLEEVSKEIKPALDRPQLNYYGKLPAISPENLGDKTFRERYNVKYAYMTGAMANGIASERMVIELGKNNILSSFGAAGLIPSRLEAAIIKIKSELGNKTFACNLIHSPSEEALEVNGVELFLKHKIRVVEASAYMDLTPYIVWYKAAGLSEENGIIKSENRVIAKVSRLEVARKFMQPPPSSILDKLVEEKKITPRQALLAAGISVADDITVEADSGGHTDNRPLVCILPAIIALRDEITLQHDYNYKIHVGAAGGIGTPTAAYSAFSMGASFIVTGSVNQACIESGSSNIVRKLLAQAEMTDVIMAPAADMFEMGVKLQVLKRGTMFPGRAQKLYELYRSYNLIDAIPKEEKEKIEKQIFRRSLEEIWGDTKDFFRERDIDLLNSAEADPKIKMALIFRWYLGLSSRWANSEEKGRELDYQIWCGPSMGAFNVWVKGTDLENPENRKVVRVAEEIMKGACYYYRKNILKYLTN